MADMPMRKPIKAPTKSILQGYQGRLGGRPRKRRRRLIDIARYFR